MCLDCQEWEMKLEAVERQPASLETQPPGLQIQVRDALRSTGVQQNNTTVMRDTMQQ